MTPSAQIPLAVHGWLEHLRSSAAVPERTWRELAGQQAWATVREAVAADVPPRARTDLYFPGTPPVLSDEVLLWGSGLASIAQAIMGGAEVADEDVAADFTRFCTGPRPVSEDWVLLDASFPAGATVDVGGYTLQTCTRDDLLQLHPLPNLEHLKHSHVLPSDPLDGAVFLHREVPDRPLPPGLKTSWEFRSQPELLHWQPLLVLLLWSPDITQMQAHYEVERGRRVQLVHGTPHVSREVSRDPETGEPREYYDASEQRGMCSVDVDQLDQFESFARDVSGRLQQVLAPLETSRSGKKEPPAVKRARRLSRAAQHLVRAAHRTTVVLFEYVPDEEFEEVLLHYVIAMEALLADEQNLDLSRKVKIRAATLWQTDKHREQVAELVRRAYNARSQYVHGDQVKHTVELSDLRTLALQVLLRWLILATNGANDVPLTLDKAILSEEVRRTSVAEPINTFFTATPSASRGQDALTLP
ncbi:HEPN domain-containing protein [Streptomyces phaeochromogenes]|uniref:hypothetical protein n=1 Tax=Streptomyces phaeochromogenes TaxID=1923 RepID=UPI0032449382